jgi:SPP1 family predicted phage head-tail adaptor
MSNGIAYLIGKTYTLDAIGQSIATETRTMVYVTEKSISRSEWYDAGQQGLNPSIQLSTPRCNYSGQREIEYEGRRYSVYRTYLNGDRVELYLELKGGTHGSEQDNG